MLTFLVSLALMLTLVWSGITWAKREERRRMSADDLNGIEEVLGSARDHR
jgi:hypothetical protein